LSKQKVYAPLSSACLHPARAHKLIWLARAPRSRQQLFIAEERMPPLAVGAAAPDFDLPAVTGTEKHRFRLSDLRGKKNVVVAFYALDWTPT
jgi:hypothetical protein